MNVTGFLEGKTAIVVGAGQTPGETIGNGRAISILFARAGAKLLCVDRELTRAQETVDAIAGEGGQASALAADITRAADCDAIIATALSDWDGIDILVNNVGIFGMGDGPAHALTEEAYDRIMDVNVKGMWRTIAAALPSMRERRRGSIVNISSLASLFGGHQLAYEISKAAVNRMTNSIANANAGRGIRCNAVVPGAMDTPIAIVGLSAMSGKDPAQIRAERDARVPLGKMGTAWDTAHAALFLASDAAGFITGAILPVDGGAGIRIN
jgi:NAD(P)-dependent dehydrogenase (short-subunit alcohol dehydrogenase family)